jgi:hypothetical protein
MLQSAGEIRADMLFFDFADESQAANLSLCVEPLGDGVKGSQVSFTHDHCYDECEAEFGSVVPNEKVANMKIEVAFFGPRKFALADSLEV